MKTIFGYTWEQIQISQSGGKLSSGVLPKTNGMITPSQYEKNEWSRMAQDCYAKDDNERGHKFSMAATLKHGESVSVAWFDALQTEYRVWLVGSEQYQHNV